MYNLFPIYKKIDIKMQAIDILKMSNILVL